MTQTQIHISHLPPAMVDSHVEQVKRAAYAVGWQEGAEAKQAQIIALIEDVNADAGTIDFILDRLRSLPLPEMTEEATP